MSPSKGKAGGHGATADRPSVGEQVMLLCLDKATGAIVWEAGLDVSNEKINKQNDSSPSPVTDGRHVWAMTGTGAVAGFTMAGEALWRRSLQDDHGAFGHMFGFGASPLLFEGLLIIPVLHGYYTDEPSYLIALDGLTGETRWHVERPTDAERESPDAYTTPTLLTHEGATVLVVSGGDYVTGHDPSNGAEIWRASGLNPRKVGNYRIIPSPVACGDMVVAPSRQRPILALRAGGQADITQSHLAWTYEDRNGPDVPTPACDGTYVYVVNDRGMVTCLDLATGGIVWGPEATVRGTVSASPLVADGKVYVTNEEAVTTVLAAGPEFKLLATNALDQSYTLSSPIVSESRLFIRTATHLYCIGSAASAP